MSSAPIRFVYALLWPVSIWGSLTHFEEHPADDYVERTTPIVAFAIGFWVCVAVLAALFLVMSEARVITAAAFEQSAVTMRVFDQRWQPLATALMWFLPLIYAIGFWLFTTRDERYPRTRAS